MRQNFGIHWFRRDLRLLDNPSLHENLKRNNGRVVGLFCFDSQFLKRKDFSHNRFGFFLKTLRSLKDDMKKAGGDLLVVDCLPKEAFPKLFSPHLTVSWNRDYEPFAIKRDHEIEALLSKNNIDIITDRDHLIVEPHELLKDDDTPYSVYTPYCRKWFSLMEFPQFSHRISKRKSPQFAFNLTWKDIGTIPFPDACDDFEKRNAKKVTIPLPDAGTRAALENLESFIAKEGDYEHARDFPATNATSRLSHFFKNGSITTAMVLSRLGENSKWLRFKKEIIWREFYYSILYNHPRVETESYLSKYKNIKWENREDYFSAWCEGRTGFPIVDAGMRELNSTGYMHNRVRMIVASFLTKDLLIDWRWGENYFMKMLLDGDLALNNGGWQWAASTGCDPQPYFRIFNPWLQSQRFDPDAVYIKNYVPELARLTAKEIHDPLGRAAIKNYPRPIVEHDVQKQKALALYRSP